MATVLNAMMETIGMEGSTRHLLEQDLARIVLLCVLTVLGTLN